MSKFVVPARVVVLVPIVVEAESAEEALKKASSVTTIGWFDTDGPNLDENGYIEEEMLDEWAQNPSAQFLNHTPETEFHSMELPPVGAIRELPRYRVSPSALEIPLDDMEEWDHDWS